MSAILLLGNISLRDIPIRGFLNNIIYTDILDGTFSAFCFSPKSSGEIFKEVKIKRIV